MTEKKVKLNDSTVIIHTLDPNGVWIGLQSMLIESGFSVEADMSDTACLRDRFKHGWFGDLQFIAEINREVVSIKFYQDLVTVNLHGGRYDFGCVSKMPYLIRLRFRWALRKIVQWLVDHHYEDETVVPKTWEDPLASFNDAWTKSRFQRDETGWPSESEISHWNRFDRDGMKIHHGDTRYYRNHGRAFRGKVYGGINGMWWIVCGPGIWSAVNSSSLYSTFPGRGRHFDHADRVQRVESLVDRAAKERDFLKAHKMSLGLKKLTGK